MLSDLSEEKFILVSQSGCQTFCIDQDEPGSKTWKPVLVRPFMDISRNPRGASVLNTRNASKKIIIEILITLEQNLGLLPDTKNWSPFTLLSFL